MNIYEKIRKAQAKAERERKARDYKVGESERRSVAGRAAAEARKDKHIDDLITGRVEPRTVEDLAILDRADHGCL